MINTSGHQDHEIADARAYTCQADSHISALISIIEDLDNRLDDANERIATLKAELDDERSKHE
jgi:peptidoglycan hydrolase CwlO-like protein